MHKDIELQKTEIDTHTHMTNGASNHEFPSGIDDLPPHRKTVLLSFVPKKDSWTWLVTTEVVTTNRRNNNNSDESNESDEMRKLLTFHTTTSTAPNDDDDDNT